MNQTYFKKSLMPLAFIVLCLLPQMVFSQIEEEAVEVSKVIENEVIEIAQVEAVPVFKKCQKKDPNGELKECFLEELSEYMHDEFEYPDLAYQMRIAGTIYLNLIFEIDGTVQEVEIARGVETSMDKEAVRVAKTITTLKPAQLNGKPVRMSMLYKFVAKP